MEAAWKVPAGTSSIEIERSRSRFIGTAGRARTVAEAKAFLAEVKSHSLDATHHAYAFRAGFGNSVQEGQSDDGEPSGTAGPPIMNHVRGAMIGNLIVVVTRYYGGVNLGTGGLVRAYGDAAREAIAALPLQDNVRRLMFTLSLPYALHARIGMLLEAHHVQVTAEAFGAEVSLSALILEADMPAFAAALRDASAGRIAPANIAQAE
jgi:uncharacterized YigZ family protein